MNENKYFISSNILEDENVSESLVADFLESEDPITAERIREYAKEIAELYKNAEAANGRGLILILNKLANSEMYRQFIKPPIKDLETRQVAAIVLSSIRRKVIEELKNYLEPKQFLLILKDIDPARRDASRRAVEATDGYHQSQVYKEYPEDNIFMDTEVEIHQRAYERFASLPGNEHVVNYFEAQVAPEWQHKIGALTKKLELYDLKYYVTTGETADFNKFLKIFKDNLMGAKYLSDNGIVLFDICLANLGYDKEKDSGILFDMDGLYLNGENHYGSYSHEGYELPELPDLKKGLATEAGMVYQFGVALKELLVWARINDGFEISDQNERIINDLINKMSKKKPGNRPSLAECIETIEKVIN